jgi:hypothetical protein
MLLIGGCINGLTGVDLDNVAAARLYERDPGKNVEKLPTSVRVPGRSGTRGKTHPTDDHPLVAFHGINNQLRPDVSRASL